MQNGYSPLISAAKIGSKEIIQLLLQWSSSDGERIDVSNAAGNVNLYTNACIHLFLASTYIATSFIKHKVFANIKL